MSILIPAFAIVAMLNVGVANYLIDTAQQYGIPENIFFGIAACESELNPKAYNPKDTDGLPAVGIFQFKDKTFKGFGGKGDIWNPEEQTRIAGEMMSRHLFRHWPDCFARTLKMINEHNRPWEK